MLEHAQPAADSEFTIGFDIGGTNLRAATISAEGDIVDSVSVPTADNARQLEAVSYTHLTLPTICSV